jgi:hypothetical protein
MKFLLATLLISMLAACTNGGNNVSVPSAGPVINTVPSNPTAPFTNTATESNAVLTSMISANANQVGDYITYRLNKWSTFNEEIDPSGRLIEISDAAKWLTTGNRTQEEIEQRFENQIDLMHMAVYVINNRLNSCFSTNSVAAAAGCFITWRDNNTSTFNNMANEIERYGTLLDIENTEIITIDQNQIRFVVDPESGEVTGATFVEGTNENTFTVRSGNEFYKVFYDGVSFIKQTLSYDSVGKDMNLSYSDFGTYSIINTDQETSNLVEIVAYNKPFAGGYNSQKIDTDDISQDLHFTGRAVGGVTSDTQHVDLSGNATLDFDTTMGISTLNAFFSNWYDVKVQNDSNGTIEFSNYTNAYNQVQLPDVPNSEGKIITDGATMSVGYYGTDSIPTEATGLVEFEKSGVGLELSFGAK